MSEESKAETSPVLPTDAVHIDISVDPEQETFSPPPRSASEDALEAQVAAGEEAAAADDLSDEFDDFCDVPLDDDVKDRGTFKTYVDRPKISDKKRSMRGIFTDPQFFHDPTFNTGAMATGVASKVARMETLAEDEPVHEGLGKQKGGTKFGTWDGVYTSCMLNIFGVIMFLRLGWVVGQAGIIVSIVIILLATVVTTTTSCSMSAICTNGEVKGGGAYYLISRALGPETGGAVGILFSIGMSIAVAMYIIGFTETLAAQLIGEDGKGFSLTGSFLWDVRVYGLFLIVILLGIALIGVGWVIKMQLGLLVLIVASILSFFVGTFTADHTDGVIGWDVDNMVDNLWPDFQMNEGVKYDFFGVFSVFFPAVTGIMAGANLSSDLKNPSKDIPTGTLYAVGHSAIVYAILAFTLGACVRRSACPGDVCDLTTVGPEGHYGLLFDTLIMARVSFFGPLVLAGIYAATFSSALASLVGAPRVLQSLAKDNIIPAIRYFAKTRANGDPVRGYLFTFVVGGACVLIGKLNAVAPLISMFFLMTYALINYSCFALQVGKSPGWRPTFKWFSAWSALLGTLLCFVCMFLTDVLWALIALVIGLALFKYIEIHDPEVSWGSAREDAMYMDAIGSVLSLRRLKQVHVKNFRPSYLFLVGDPETQRQPLVHLAGCLRFRSGVTMIGNVVFGDYRQDIQRVREQWRSGYYSSKRMNVKAILETVITKDLRSGVQMLCQCSGLGRIRANTVVLGFRESWGSAHEGNSAYVEMLRDMFRMRLGVMVCRGLDRVEWNAPNPNGSVDIWWLMDDGGLTILISHLLSLSDFWKRNTLSDKLCARLFIVTQDRDTMSKDLIAVANLLKKLRIEWGEPIVVSLVNKVTKKETPLHETLTEYDEFCRANGAITIDEHANPRRSMRWLRISELMCQHSSDSKLVIATLPYPRKTDPTAYLSLCDYITSRDMPPFILMKGSGRNCLTYYSE
jgi:amino acid transporter